MSLPPHWERKLYHLPMAPPEGCSPTEARFGRRHVYCVGYRGCLNYSVAEGWRGFDCSDCQVSGREKHEPVAKDSNY